MSEVEERVARAMWEAREDIESVGAPNRLYFERSDEIMAMARAAISAYEAIVSQCPRIADHSCLHPLVVAKERG